MYEITYWIDYSTLVHLVYQIISMIACISNSLLYWSTRLVNSYSRSDSDPSSESILNYAVSQLCIANNAKPIHCSSISKYLTQISPVS